MDGTRREIIDVHVHVGLKGDQWPLLGHFSKAYQKELLYKVFLFYAGIKESEVADSLLKTKTLENIAASHVDKVVCLALDHVYDIKGKPHPARSHVWVANKYIVDHLRKELPDRILFGASIHPYDDNFGARVKKCVDDGAVLVKWLPSAQQIDLAEDKTGLAMKILAAAGPNGKPLPLLVHTGAEYAIPSSDERTGSYNFLSWSWKDKLDNRFRFKKPWHTPRVQRIHENLRAALDEGAVIIFAHCGLPYFLSGPIGRHLEHSDFDVVKGFLEDTAAGKFKGRCYADVSALATPFRRLFFRDIRQLPPQLLLFGSDFPTPVFELSADLKEMREDFEAVLKGDFTRIIIPQDNLIDVNHRELRHFFPGHPMFTNFGRMIGQK